MLAHIRLRGIRTIPPSKRSKMASVSDDDLWEAADTIFYTGVLREFYLFINSGTDYSSKQSSSDLHRNIHIL